MEKDSRKSYPIKLTPGRDEDLIDWLDAIPDGERQGVILAALRAYKPTAIGLAKAPSLRDIATDVAWIKQALEDMPGWLESKLSGLTVAPGGQEPPPAVEESPRLSADELEQVKKNMKKNQW